MFERILLPVDLTDKHGRALEVAGQLAGRNRATVVLLHVIEVLAGLSMDEEKDFYARLEKRALHHLQRLGHRLKDGQVTWRAEVICGNRGPEILRHAQVINADLIVLTAPHLDPNSPAAGWGSLSHKIGFLASCPVLLVK